MVASTRVEVRRGKNESSSALIRRFSRRAQGLGLVREMRDRRYFKRYKSKNVEHKRAMVTGEKRARYNELVKLGKIDPAARTRRGAKR
jgi:ribosomal protein S21